MFHFTSYLFSFISSSLLLQISMFQKKGKKKISDMISKNIVFQKFANSIEISFASKNGLIGIYQARMEKRGINKSMCVMFHFSLLLCFWENFGPPKIHPYVNFSYYVHINKWNRTTYTSHNSIKKSTEKKRSKNSKQNGVQIRACEEM